MGKKTIGELSDCDNIKSVLAKIENGYKPVLDDWASIQSHLKGCELCCNFFNKIFLRL